MKWQKENPERARELSRLSAQRIKSNPKRLKARRAANLRHYNKNREKYLASHTTWRNSNPWAKEADRCRSLVRATLVSFMDGGKKFKALVGCSGNQLRAKFEKQFDADMCWSNFGRGGWTIGHIKPCGEFKDSLLTPEGKAQCFHFSNLKPEWCEINRAKHTSQELTDAQKDLLTTPLTL